MAMIKICFVTVHVTFLWFSFSIPLYVYMHKYCSVLGSSLHNLMNIVLLFKICSASAQYNQICNIQFGGIFNTFAHANARGFIFFAIYLRDFSMIG